MNTNARARSGLRMSRAVGFWTAAAVLASFLFGSTAPTPLYDIYQRQWHFSAAVLTVIFAVYAAAVLMTLLVAGKLSDYLGRRPVMVGALIITVVGVVLFLEAHGIAWLIVARVLQGIGTGAATPTISSALIDLQGEGSGRGALLATFSPGIAMALGAMVSAVLAQYAPNPTHLIWLVLLVVFVVGIFAVLAMPESVQRRPGALHSLIPRAGVPRDGVSVFVTGVPGMVAVWALGSFVQSLGPALISGILESTNLLWGAFVVALLSGLGSLGLLAFRNASPSITTRVGLSILVAGSLLTLAAVAVSGSVWLFVGTAVSGVGWGVSYLGLFRNLVAIAKPSERAELVSLIYVVAYLGLSVPAVIAGLAVNRWGLRQTSLAFIAAVALLAAITAANEFWVVNRGWGRETAPKKVQ
jgi:MFS family permease